MNTSKRIHIASLGVAKILYDFIDLEALPGTGVRSEHFWSGLAGMVRDFGPRNRELLATRDALQAKIDDFHRTNVGNPVPIVDYKRFLHEIGYLVPEVEAFTIRTSNTDPEIAETAGPQLVVPLSNARYALNAANARWGSLYDALYGTDARTKEVWREEARSTSFAGSGWLPARANCSMKQCRSRMAATTTLSGMRCLSKNS